MSLSDALTDEVLGRLIDRAKKLRKLELRDLPLAELKRWFEQQWVNSEFILPSSLTLDRLEGFTYKAAFPFGAGWTNFGGTDEDASYSRIGQLVVLQGRVTKSGGAPAGGDVIGTLPAGYRPVEDLIFPVVSTGNNFGRVDVQADGDVVWQAGSAVETDSTSLSGITFFI